MPQMSKVELYAAIRCDHRGGMKMRELERKYNVSWRTVKKAVDSVWPEHRKKLPPRPTALDPYKPVVDRLTFNGTIIETGTDSYRLATTRARAEQPAVAG
jgi:transposase